MFLGNKAGLLLWVKRLLVKELMIAVYFRAFCFDLKTLPSLQTMALYRFSITLTSLFNMEEINSCIPVAPVYSC